MSTASHPLLPEVAAELARKGDTAGLAAMLRDGLAVDAQDAKGNTLLMLAAYAGLLSLDVPLVPLMAGFGGLIALAMALLIAWRARPR